MLDSIYHMTFKLHKNCIFDVKREVLPSKNNANGRHYLTLLNLSTNSGLSILLYGVISLPDAKSCDKSIFYIYASSEGSGKTRVYVQVYLSPGFDKYQSCVLAYMLFCNLHVRMCS